MKKKIQIQENKFAGIVRVVEFDKNGHMIRYMDFSTKGMTDDVITEKLKELSKKFGVKFLE